MRNACNFSNVKPIMMDLPYPPVRAERENQGYANLLSVDYCGSVSELSAIAQYINHENRLSGQECALAQTILGIAVAEMIHLQMLGELICLLGRNIDFVARYQNGRKRMWTPAGLAMPEKRGQMLDANIESEMAAINQYKMHIKMIRDDCVVSVLQRIIKDEEYHIMLLRALEKGY